ncbi:hypothetical protein [Neisseria subflava]|uniref:hypothetical protein n=1 Tax=Neisseria subflava TaxID=28449 RepID=UPI0020B8534B|nr:hypothetical protein [Neisseria subflava]
MYSRHLTETEWGNCAEGLLLGTLLVVMLLVSILAAAFTAYRESVRSANLRAAHAALLEKCALYGAVLHEKGQL